MLNAIFILISLLSLLLLYFGIGKNKRLVFFFTVYQVLIGIFAIAGVFQVNPLLFPMAILGSIILVIFGMSVIDTKKVKVNYLLGIHILRIPVELVLYQLYLQGKIPRLMTFVGWNFDILIGILALMILIYQFFRRRNIKPIYFTIWNIIGVTFLLIIVCLAILSSPLPIQQLAFEQPNIAMLEFPYCFLPTCVVPIVFMSHFIALRKMSYYIKE